MEERNENRRKPIFRAVALALAAVLIWTATVSPLGGISRLTAALAEGDPLTRIYALLKDGIDQPQTYEDYSQLASIAIGQGDYAQALGYLEECEALADAEDGAAMAELYLRKASLYMLLRDDEQTLAALESALAHDPESSQALLLRAQIELSQEAYADAASDLEGYLRLVPDDISVRQSLAQVYEALGRYVDAADCYEAIFAQRPQESPYRLDALRCRMLAGEYEAALEGFDAFLQADGTDAGEQAEADEQAVQDRALRASAHFLRACCEMQLADYEAATADFERAIAHGYDEGAALEQLVTCAYVAGSYEAAITYGERLLALPGAAASPGALYQQMGVSAMSLERYEEAVGYLTQAIESSPELAGSCYYRGVSLLSLKRYEEAVADFTSSIEQEYLVQFCYYNRGVCHVNLLDYESALDDMEMTLLSGDEQTLNDAATDILWQLAQYYEAQGAQQEEQQDAQQTAE